MKKIIQKSIKSILWIIIAKSDLVEKVKKQMGKKIFLNSFYFSLNDRNLLKKDSRQLFLLKIYFTCLHK